MPSAVVAVVPGLTGVALLARVVGQAGVPITQASVASIAWTATDLEAGAVIATGTFAVATSVYDSLQQSDPRWTKDSRTSPGADGAWGYNVALALPYTATGAASTPAAVPAGYPAAVGPRPVQVDAAFTPVVGQPFRVSWLLKVLPAYG